jgi:hypothetical protein
MSNNTNSNNTNSTLTDCQWWQFTPALQAELQKEMALLQNAIFVGPTGPTWDRTAPHWRVGDKKVAVQTGVVVLEQWQLENYDTGVRLGTPEELLAKARRLETQAWEAMGGRRCPTCHNEICPTCGW